RRGPRDLQPGPHHRAGPARPRRPPRRRRLAPQPGRGAGQRADRRQRPRDRRPRGASVMLAQFYDPLLGGHVDGGVVAIVLGKTLVAFGLLLVSVILMIWFERKVLGDLQNRVGPNKAGPFGLLQTVA